MGRKPKKPAVPTLPKPDEPDEPKSDEPSPGEPEDGFFNCDLSLSLLEDEPNSGPIIGLVQTRLTGRRRRVLRLLRESLFAKHELVDGKHLDSHSDVIRWLLDRVGDAAGIQ